MKTIYSFAALFCVSAAVATAVMAFMPTAEQVMLTITPVRVLLDEPQSDLKGKQVVDWTLQNESSSAIRIESILTDCGCTVVQRSPKVIEPSNSAGVTTERTYSTDDEASRKYAIHVHFSLADSERLEMVSRAMEFEELSGLAE